MAKKVYFSLSGTPVSGYRPVGVLSTNEKIRRSAEKFIHEGAPNDMCVKNEFMRSVWIDQNGLFHSSRVSTDLFVSCGTDINIQNSIWRT